MVYNKVLFSGGSQGPLIFFGSERLAMTSSREFHHSHEHADGAADATQRENTNYGAALQGVYIGRPVVTQLLKGHGERAAAGIVLEAAEAAVANAEPLPPSSAAGSMFVRLTITTEDNRTPLQVAAKAIEQNDPPAAAKLFVSVAHAPQEQRLFPATIVDLQYVRQTPSEDTALVQHFRIASNPNTGDIAAGHCHAGPATPLEGPEAKLHISEQPADQLQEQTRQTPVTPTLLMGAWHRLLTQPLPEADLRQYPKDTNHQGV
jgi:hypothetical protein